jgi:aconitate hydratase
MAEDKGKSGREIAYRPARVLMQDFTGVPAVVDLAAMRDAAMVRWRRPGKDQPAGARRPGHRPLGDDRRIRHADAFKKNVEMNTSATRSATSSCAGARGVRQLPRRAARHRHLPPGEPRISGPDRLDQGRDGETVAYPDTCVGTDAHHHDQRPGRPRLGRRRHRGGSRHARPADLHADPGSHRLQADRQDGKASPRPTSC